MAELGKMAHALGGEVNAGGISCPGPGHSKYDRSMRVFIEATAPDGFRVTSFAGDNWQLCRDEVRARLSIFEGAPWAISPSVERPTKCGRTNVRAIELWNAAGPVHGSLGETYLGSRALSPPPGDAVFRFHRRCPFKLEDGATAHLPALLGLFRDIITDKPCGIHRTALKADGSGKADLPGLGNPKKMLGRAKGAAIKLSADADVALALGIAEGIETGLSVLQTFEWGPVWAIGSAGGIDRFPALAGVECLTIFADHDGNGAGMAAAQKCAERWVSVGKEVIIRSPRHLGDWNSVGG